MSRTAKGAAASLLLLLLVAGHTSLAATPTPASGATWADNQYVPYRWKADAQPPKWLRPAIHAAAADSNRSRGARAATFAYDANATSWIGYTADIPTSYAVGYAVRNVPNSYNIRLRPQGHVLDWGTLKWCQFYDNWPNGCYDAELITLHEFGHVQTLGHVDESLGEPWLDSIMHAGPRTKAKIGWNEHDFGRCDVARLQIRYRALTPSTPYSTCLSLPTAATLTASSTSVSAGSGVTFTATLHVSSSADYAKLRGEPISNRAVLLQRRLPGDTSWTTHAQMNQTATEGRYRLTVTPATTYEWRARFAKQADEGLKASSSAVSKVTVSSCTGDVCCSGSVCRMSTDDFGVEAAEQELLIDGLEDDEL
jgi:hypothetical protein